MDITLSNEITCIAEIKAAPGKRKELLEKLLELMPLSKREAGCVRYELHQSIEDENIFTFVDRFSDQSAFDLHCETDYIKIHFDEIIPKLSEYIKLSVHKEIKS